MFKDVNILCVGDIMLDKFVTGSVERISPEAPVPVFRWSGEKRMLGGVGNVVANLRALGVSATVMCRIGDDIEGREVKELLREVGAKAVPFVSKSVPTIRKTRFVSKNNHVLRVDQETVAPLSASEEKRFVAAFRKEVAKASLVIFSDYLKGLLSLSLSRKLIAVAKAKKVPVFVDPKGKDYRKYAGATLVKPNRKELETVIGSKVTDVPNSARRLLETIGIENAVVTLSEQGMTLVPAKGGSVHIPAEVREVFDVSGAGDTTIAVLAAAYASGAGLEEAMKLANRAAGIVVGKVGTATVTDDELFASLNRRGKIFDRNALKAQVKAWQNAGYRVGFTNGCFDCLHAGHLDSFRQAKEHCDKLVVAVNTDSCVRKLKGPSRPIQDERTRSGVIAALDMVDAVVLFAEKTALPLVKALRPDVIAKEGYALADWPEAQFVVSAGGEAVTLKRIDGYSTTGLVKKLKKD